MQRRSFSVDSTGQKEKVRPLSFNRRKLSSYRPEDAGENGRNGMGNGKLGGQTIFKAHKDEAIKEIINGYFTEDINCDQMLISNSHRMGRRINRHRKMP